MPDAVRGEHDEVGLLVDLQKAGSWVVRQASDTDVPDTTSGFRAYNREAAIQMAVVSKYTYTLETIIQAGKLLVATDHVRVGTNPKTRESRLFPSVSSYVRRNALSILRIYAQYEPLRVFFSLAALVALVGAVAWGRFFWAYVSGDGAGHVQSLIFGAVLFNAAVVLGALGMIGDLLYGQRIMVQRIFERIRRIELELDVPPSHYEPGARADGPGRDHRRPGRTDHGGSRGGAGVSRRRSRSTARGRSPATPTTSTARPTRSSAA